jgi:hypothetical protein
LCLLGKCSTTWDTLQPYIFLFFFFFFFLLGGVGVGGFSGGHICLLGMHSATWASPKSPAQVGV